jgi:two-component system, LytTR family, response regulator
MSTLKAILIDDERSSLESLTYEIKEYCPEVEVIKACQDPQEGLTQLQKLKPDILFLDIEMPGMNGFELLQKLPDIPFHVIFITAYDQFAIKAFEFNAIDYLLKPVRKTKLISAVQKVVDRQHSRFDKIDLDALIQNIRVQSHSGLENIALPTSDGFSMVHINDITQLQAESNYTWVYLTNHKKYLVTKTLKDMEDMLRFPQYFRPHKSFLVNLNHVDRYVRGQGGYLIMKDNAQIPVARAQKLELLRVLKL